MNRYPPGTRSLVALATLGVMLCVGLSAHADQDAERAGAQMPASHAPPGGDSADSPLEQVLAHERDRVTRTVGLVIPAPVSDAVVSSMPGPTASFVRLPNAIS